MIQDFFKKIVFYVSINAIFSATIFIVLLSFLYGEFPPSFSRIRNQSEFLQDLAKKSSSLNLLRSTTANSETAIRAADGDFHEPSAVTAQPSAVSNPTQFIRDRLEQATDSQGLGNTTQDQLKLELKKITSRLQSIEAEQLVQQRALQALQRQMASKESLSQSRKK